MERWRRARTGPGSSLARRLAQHTTTRDQNREWPAAGMARVCAESWVGDRVRPGHTTEAQYVLEAAALGARGRNPMSCRLATRGAHLLDSRLELRREVHGRDELIERKAIGRHGLIPGQRCRGTDLSVRRADRAGEREVRCGGGPRPGRLLGCKYGTVPACTHTA